MKIKSLLIGMLACSALVACTNDDLLEDNGQENQKAGNSYLAVKLVSPSASSRATGDYAFGNTAEQTVTNARFYLFKADGSAYDIKDESTNKKNFVDATPGGTFNDEGKTNVETVLETVLVIDKSQAAPPAKILAVLNYPETELGAESMDLDELQDVLDNFGTINADNGAPYTTSGNFVMSNSAYVDAAGNVVYATPIAAENIQIDKEEAMKAENAVEIYVERVAAKVQTQVEAASTQPTDEKAQTFFVKEGKYYAFTGQADANDDPIYARLKGWRVTNITSKSKLIKSLETTANANYTWTWNNPTNYRSYWSDDAGQTLSWAWNFNETNLSFDTNNWEYYNENTKNAAGKNSQLLVAVEFVTIDDGEVSQPQPIAEWYGVKYTLDDLKTHVAGALADKLFTYDEETKVYSSITADAITFTQVEADPNADERYISKIGVATAQYYYKSGESMIAYDSTGNTTLASVINALQPAKIWGNIVNGAYVGGGYYYVDIIHNAGTITKDAQGKVTSDTNVYGLVRNHWYLLTLKNLNGLGTPVYDPEKVIITERPDTDYSYISAEINVLAWRMVSQDVNLQ